MLSKIDRKIFGEIIKFSKKFRRDLLLVFSIIVFISCLDAVNHWALSKVFDTSGIDKDISVPLLWIILSGGSMVFKLLVTKWREKIEVRKLDVVIQNYLNEYSIGKFFTFSNGQHLNEHSGIKQNIIQTGFGSLRNQMNIFIYTLVPSLSQFFVALVIFYWLNLWIGLAYTIFSVLFIWGIIKFNGFLTPRVDKVRKVEIENSRLIAELYRYVTLIKNEVAEVKSLLELHSALGKHHNTYCDTWLGAVDKLMLIRLSTQLFRFMTIVFAIFLINQGQITMGSIFLIYLWSGNYINAVWTITDLQKQYITDKINIEKYFQLIETKPDVELHPNPITEGFDGDIEFKNITFSYPKRVDSTSGNLELGEAVLKDISFKIESGTKVAFVGESGSGKSTIANLIRRAFDPQQGEISVNNYPLKNLHLKKFLQTIGSVDQEIILFDRTIRENVSLGSNRILSDEELSTIAKLSGIENFFHKLEQGWDTTIGERGAKLSGGEKQRIGIARALAKNPRILIFDEATSALDSRSEKQVSRAIEKSSTGITSIIITHRLSTSINCDKIFVMKAGKILDQGTHTELLDNSQYYRELFKGQITPKTHEQ